jgi:hypothetical protein
MKRIGIGVCMRSIKEACQRRRRMIRVSAASIGRRIWRWVGDWDMARRGRCWPRRRILAAGFKRENIFKAGLDGNQRKVWHGIEFTWITPSDPIRILSEPISQWIRIVRLEKVRKDNSPFNLSPRSERTYESEVRTWSENVQTGTDLLARAYSNLDISVQLKHLVMCNKTIPWGNSRHGLPPLWPWM